MTNRVIRVLHVDDVEEEFILVRELLSIVKDIEFEFQWAPDMQSAMQAIQQLEFDVCLVDYYMGKDSGLDFARAAIAKGIVTPFILMSGQKEHAINKEALEIGIRQSINKNDITPSILLKAIQDALR